jgi:hypothetical protein
MRFDARTPVEGRAWQEQARAKLFALLMGGNRPVAVPLDPQVLRRIDVPEGGYRLEELSLQTLPDRRAHVWLALPQNRRGRTGAVLALHGHGGTGEDVVRGTGLYWYGRAWAEMGYAVISPDIGQHDLQHAHWSLMGERVWDALRCVDYLVTRPEVDPRRLVVAGLSLGGETAMYVGALDKRLRAVCSSGWLTTVANMQTGHCPCWNFPGLEAHFDFADVFACVAPRPLVCEIGEQERAPGGFPLNIARGAFTEIQQAYRAWQAADRAVLEVHPGGHVFTGRAFWPLAREVLGQPARGRDRSAEVAWLTESTRQLLAGCRVPADDGGWLYTPDGRGNYQALWTRDFVYLLEHAGDLLPPDEVESCLRRLIGGLRADGATPDRVQPDGVAVYTGGPPDQPLGKPNLDNAQFLAIGVDEHLRRLPREQALPRFKEWSGPLRRAMDWIPRWADGLVWNDPEQPHSPYGFTDTIGKTGALFFESLLYWTACQRLAHWHQLEGDLASADEYRRRARNIEQAVAQLWDDRAGAFWAATKDCRQWDVWGNAYALWLDFPLGTRRARVAQWLHDNQHRIVWRGQVRHLLRGEHWGRLLAPVQPERYQNGAYWATASGWYLHALALTDRRQARRWWEELITDFRQGGICECVNTGYRQLPSYVVSAANPLAAARRLGF